MQKPRRVRRKLFSADDSKEREFSKEEIVTRKLFALGFRVNCKGFSYLRDEILIAIDNKYKKTSKLHEEVAAKYSVKPINVERCIRTAINIAWRNKKEAIQKLIGEKEKPTTGRFIMAIADKISK